MFAQHQGLLCFTLCAPHESSGCSGSWEGAELSDTATLSDKVRVSVMQSVSVPSCSLRGTNAGLRPIQGQLHLSPLSLSLQPGFFHPAWCLWRPLVCQFPLDQISSLFSHPPLMCAILTLVLSYLILSCCTKPPRTVNDHFCFCYGAYHFVLPCLVEKW